jgi:hypothetical protein
VIALASLSGRARGVFALLMLFRSRLFVASRVSLEGARWCEFTKLVAHHFFRNVHRNELVAIVHLECQAHKLRQDGGATAPCLDRSIALAASGFRFL